LDTLWMVVATASMMWLFPAPVAASMQQGDLFLVIQAMMLSWDCC
jgi:hypothetical protein